MICEYCGSEHDGSYGSGRFCSAKCARTYSTMNMPEESNKRRLAGLKKARDITIEKNRKKRKNKKKRGQYKASYNASFYNTNIRNLHTMETGKLGELFVASKFISHGYEVFVPLVDRNGVDMIIKKGQNIKTVQVKTSNTVDTKNSVSIFRIVKHERHIKNGSYTQKRKRYSPEEVNLFSLYSTAFNDAYLVENTENAPLSINIRDHYSSPRGTQPSVTHMAEDYQIDKVLNEMDMGINQSDIVMDIDYKEVDNEDDV